MPLIIREEDKKLNKKQVVIPDEVAKKLYQNMNTYANDKTSDGYKRLRSLTNKDYNKRSDGKDGQHNSKMTVSFADARRIAHDMKHMPQTPKNKEFNMLGGFDTYNAVKTGLKQARSAVKQNTAVPPVPKLDKSDTKAPEIKQDDFKMGNANVSIKEVYITDKQAMMLKEYHTELNIPFNHPDRAYDPKMNYEHLIDFFEKIGKYGQLPPSGDMPKNSVCHPYEEIDVYFNANPRLDQLYTGYFSYYSIHDFLQDNLDEHPEFFKDFEAAKEMFENNDIEYDYTVEFKDDMLTDEGAVAFDEDFKHYIKDFLQDQIRLTTDNRGLIYVERVITIPNLMGDGQVSNTYDRNYDNVYPDFYEKLIQNYDGLGNSWTYLPGHGEAYCGESFHGGTTHVILKGYVSPDSVDWVSTCELNIANGDEYEIYIPSGQPIEIIEIEIDHDSLDIANDNGGKKLPLKAPIIINA